MESQVPAVKTPRRTGLELVSGQGVFCSIWYRQISSSARLLFGFSKVREQFPLTAALHGEWERDSRPQISACRLGAVVGEGRFVSEHPNSDSTTKHDQMNITRSI